MAIQLLLAITEVHSEVRFLIFCGKPSRNLHHNHSNDKQGLHKYRNYALPFRRCSMTACTCVVFALFF